MTITVPRDGDEPEMGIGDIVPRPTPVVDDSKNWEPLPGRSGYLRHRITGAIQPDPKVKIYQSVKGFIP